MVNYYIIFIVHILFFLNHRLCMLLWITELHSNSN